MLPQPELLDFLASIDLFRGLDRESLRDLTERIQHVTVAGGETLTRQGDPGDCVYILVNGRLRVFFEDPAGGETVVGEVGRGEVVGEMSLLRDAPRSATVVAIRDSELIRISRRDAAAFIRIHPEAMIEVSRQIVERLERSLKRPKSGHGSLIFTVLPANGETPASGFTERLVEALGAFGSTLHLSSRKVDQHLGADVSQAPDHGPANDRIVQWLNEQEVKHAYIVQETDWTVSNWTRRCLRQADRILLVGLMGSDPSLGLIEAELQARASRRDAARRELILLHDGGSRRAGGALDWLEKRQVDEHHNVHLKSQDDLRRLSRILTDRAVGVTLGGGGARGLAHVGALRALGELGVPIDYIGGASMGAIIGAAYASEMDADVVHGLCEKHFVEGGSLLDFTFPIVSLTSGGRISRRLEGFFQDARIEDLRLKFFCVSSNLTRSEVMVHREGPIWKRIRASISLPGILPPVFHDGDMLVDGGVMNNLPVDVMRRLCGGGTVIALDVSPKVDLTMKAPIGEEISGWRVLGKRLNPFSQSLEVPSIANVLMRTTLLASASAQKLTSREADLYVCPPLGEFGLLEFKAFARIADVGYRHVRKHLKEWLSAAGPSRPWL